MAQRRLLGVAAARPRRTLAAVGNPRGREQNGLPSAAAVDDAGLPEPSTALGSKRRGGSLAAVGAGRATGASVGCAVVGRACVAVLRAVAVAAPLTAVARLEVVGGAAGRGAAKSSVSGLTCFGAAARAS